MRVAIGIEYDGSRFFGWQTQPGDRTVQDVVENAISGIAARPVSVVCAGRTDRGVHALEQVAHFDVDVDRPLSAWVRGCNALLPDSVSVLWSCAVPDRFHARYSATARTYRYLLLNRAVRPGLDNNRIGWFHGRLDVERMREAACRLVGTHDYSAFRAAECQARSPVRTVQRFDISCHDHVIEFEVTANAFLHHMVRNMVGTLVHIGKGARPPEWIAELLAARDRRFAAPTFSPAGLYLVSVAYPQELLPGRAAELHVNAEQS